jgi:gluconolactonase
MSTYGPPSCFESLDRRFERLFFPTVRLELLHSGCRWAEGPAWFAAGRYLVWSDIPNDRMLRWDETDGSVSVFRQPAWNSNGHTVDQEGRLVSCEHRGRCVSRTEHDGRRVVLADRFEGKRLNSPNDIVVSRSGHVYFTDPAFGKAQDTRELDFYGVYHLTPKGELRLIAKPQGRPNGIALSPNGRILYVNNSDERNVRAYDVEHNGEVSNERILISGIDGVPDGMKVDEKGNLYVAAKDIIVYSPEGKEIGRIPVSESASNCAFGDPDFQTLYITARTSVFRVRLEGVKGAVQY